MGNQDLRDPLDENGSTVALDIPSLWVNFLEFPREFDDDESVLHADPQPPEYAEPLFTPVPRQDSYPNRKRELRRYETDNFYFHRFGRGRHNGSRRHCAYWRRGPGKARNRFHRISP